MSGILQRGWSVMGTQQIAVRSFLPPKEKNLNKAVLVLVRVLC